jgi:hypothetical protein
MFEQRIADKQREIDDAEILVRSARKVLLDAEGRDHIAGGELVRLQLALTKAEEDRFWLRAELQALAELQAEFKGMPTASPSTVDTAVREADVIKFEARSYDVVQLARQGGVIGSKVWSSPRLDSQERRSDGIRKIERLIVYVDDDPTSPAAVKRVRDALGLGILPIEPKTLA